MRRSIFACGLLLALAGISSVVATAAGARGNTEPTVQHKATAQRDAHSTAHWNAVARRARAATKHWLTVVRGRPPRMSAHTNKSSSAQEARSLARKWQRREIAASRLAHHPPKLRAWHCIHHYEGSWQDPNAPYWGGLQMDYSFQSAYGGWLLKHKGTANKWAPLAQIWAGVRAWRVRGFEPWSSSAHACGVY
jgi:hypothetical protein